MQKYGMIKDGDLLLSSRQLDGYKPVVYAEIPPKFDQTTQYVEQAEPEEDDDHIYIGITLHDLPDDEDEGEEFEDDVF